MRLARLAGVGLVALALLTGCSKDEAVQVKGPTPDPQAHAGGVLRVGILRPTTIDPQLLPSGDTSAALVVRTMCDPLVGADPVSRELSAAVASDWRVLGGTGVQVQIRHGLKFSDGSAVSARDVAYSLRRLVDPNVVAPQTALLNKVLGYSGVQEGKFDVSSMSGIKTTSSDAVQVTLSEVDSQFVYALDQPFATPVSRAAAAKRGFSAHPVCVGPYRLKGAYTGTESVITLERNPFYSGTRPILTRAGQGWADQVQFTIFPTRKAAAAALARGSLDAALIGSHDVVSSVAGSRVLKATTGRLEYVGLPDKEPFTQPLVDAALSRSLDRQRLIDTVFGGGRTPAYNLVPPTLPDSLLPTGPVTTCGISPTGNLAEAKSLLASAGVKTLGTFPVYFNDEFDNAKLINAVASQWSQLGLKLTRTPVSFAELISRGEGSGGFDGLFRMAITADYADQSKFVLPLVSIEALGKTNYAGYNGELLTRQVKKLQKAVPVGDQRIQSLAVTRATCAVPVIPIAWYDEHLAISSGVVVAAHDGVDRAVGLPELRELAVG
ncbi:MAG: peptide/nickel transport system substrate-binding protein [Frankiaceae bacterium]|nr:peptide/nickel transport system substrate-binding protein [Frankiaceae bacterium]